jgi:hypothetical protein
MPSERAEGQAMKVYGIAAALVLASAGAAMAQNTQTQGATTTTAAPATSGTAETASPFPARAFPIARLLQEGYEIKTGFAAPDGSAYLALEKGASAYLCRSGTVPTCDRLN